MDDPALGLPAEVVVAGRLTVGAVFLLVMMWFKGEKLPPIRDVKRWRIMAYIGVIGSVAPFFLLSVAQQRVDSSLASLYLAAAPLFVAIMACWIFRIEAMTLNIALGLAIGFVGILVLFGPDAVTQFGSASMVAQVFCLLAAFCYGSTTIAARFMPDMPPTAMSAGFISLAMVASWFGLLTVDFASLTPSWTSIISTVALGVFPTALAAVVYMSLVKQTSPTFIGLSGYVIPVIAIILGFVIFGETQDISTGLAFALIIGGVWVSQRAAKLKSPRVPEDV